MMVTAMDRKGSTFADTLRNCEIQMKRDELECLSCGHRCVSHGYGDDVLQIVWPDGSRIGAGPCGICECTAFHPGLLETDAP